MKLLSMIIEGLIMAFFAHLMDLAFSSQHLPALAQVAATTKHP
jgi:hypothetical protein